MNNKENIQISTKSNKSTDNLISNNNWESIHYLENIVSKQLELYNWCEEKVSTLATIDSILIGAVTLFLERL